MTLLVICAAHAAAWGRGVTVPPIPGSPSDPAVVGEGQEVQLTFSLCPMTGGTVTAAGVQFTQVETTIPEGVEWWLGLHDVHTGTQYMRATILAERDGWAQVFMLDTPGLLDLQAAIDRGDRTFSVGLSGEDDDAPGTFRLVDISLPVELDGEPLPDSDGDGYPDACDDKSADLAVTMFGPESVAVGGELNYSIQVTSFGPDAISGARLVLDLPPGAGFVDATICDLFGSCAPCGEAAGRVTCDLGELQPWFMSFASVRTLAPATVGPAVATARVISETDPLADNDAASVTTQVVLGADLEGTLTVTGHRLLAISFTVDNHGPDPAAGVYALVFVPWGTEASVTTSSGAPCGRPLAGISCPLGDLAPGERGWVNVVMRAGPGGGTFQIEGSTIAITTPDPDMSNNHQAHEISLQGQNVNSYHSTQFEELWLDAPCAQDTIHVEGERSLRQHERRTGDVVAYAISGSFRGTGVGEGGAAYDVQGTSRWEGTYSSTSGRHHSEVTYLLTSRGGGPDISISETVEWSFADGVITIDLDEREVTCHGAP